MFFGKFDFMLKARPPKKVRDIISRAETDGRWVKATSRMEVIPPDIAKVRGESHLYNPWRNVGFDPVIPETGVLFLDGGCSLGRDGWTLTREGDLLADFSWFRNEAKMRLHGYKNPEIREVTKISGTCLDLSSTWCAGNYGHWLLDAVGRLSVLELAGFDPDMFDHIHLPLGKSNQAPNLLDLLKINKSKLIVTKSNHSLLQFDTLVRPSIAGRPNQYHPCLPEFLRRKAAIPTGEATDKIFLHRAGSNRILINEAEVLKAITSRGFKIVDPATAALGAYATAGIVISCHQAGLSDLVFNRPGTTVIELLPSDHQAQYYQSISNAAGHDYYCFMCESTDNRPSGSVGDPSLFDFTADVAKLETLLDELEHDPTRRF